MKAATLSEQTRVYKTEHCHPENTVKKGLKAPKISTKPGKKTEHNRSL